MYRHYLADTLGVLANVAGNIGDNHAEYPMFTDLLEKVQNQKVEQTSEQIKAHILERLTSPEGSEQDGFIQSGGKTEP